MSLAAAYLGSGEPELFPEYGGKGAVVLHYDVPFDAVDKKDFLNHPVPSSFRSSAGGGAAELRTCARPCDGDRNRRPFPLHKILRAGISVSQPLNRSLLSPRADRKIKAALAPGGRLRRLREKKSSLPKGRRTCFRMHPNGRCPWDRSFRTGDSEEKIDILRSKFQKNTN